MNEQDKAYNQTLMIHAYHEAGHAVAAHVFGFRIKELNIIAHETFGGDFNIELPEEIADPANWRYNLLREQVEKYDVMLMSGYAASELAVKDKNLLYGTARSDEKTLRKDAQESFPSPDSDPWIGKMDSGSAESKYAVFVECRWLQLQEAYQAWIKERARVLVRFHPHRQAIEILALNLVANRTIDPETAHKIIAGALTDASQLKDIGNKEEAPLSKGITVYCKRVMPALCQVIRPSKRAK